ncbi:MAG: hypothetical protein LBH94_06135, partial [Deltaproteobacteria bacterium]|nr:hypothetical protein [Deltaproteobacteria bacterium]
MTTKIKIISGFVSMMLIILIVAGLGYRTLDESVDGVEVLFRNARMDVAVTSSLASFNDATTNVNTFLTTYDPQFATTASAKLADVLQSLDAAIADM